MRFCDKHWSAVREAIDARGLSHLVAQSGKEAVDQLVSELQGKPSEFIDPLMAAHNMIMSEALEGMGLALLCGDDLCPVCEAMKGIEAAHGVAPAETERNWIEGPADAALRLCRERGLVPTPGVPEPPVT